MQEVVWERRCSNFFASQNSLVPDDFIHRPSLVSRVLLARPRNHVIEPASFHVLFKLFVPKCVKMIAQFFRQFPSLLRWQLAYRFADLGDRAHAAQLYIKARNAARSRITRFDVKFRRRQASLRG